MTTVAHRSLGMGDFKDGRSGVGWPVVFAGGMVVGALASTATFASYLAYKAYFRRVKRHEIHRLRSELAVMQAANPAHTLDLKLASRGRAVERADSAVKPRMEQSTDAPVFSIVLTGGPMGGKSSCLEVITKALALRGYEVYVAPEIPTLLLNGGCRYPKTEGGPMLEAFETALLHLQWQLENSFFKIALAARKPSVIIYDRGLMDVRAFVPDTMWQSMLTANGWSEDVFMGRYDLVMHLMSAASGLQEVYEEVCSSQPNSRIATIPAARDLDARLVACWQAHPKHIVVPNYDDFEVKKNRALQHVLDMIRTAEQMMPVVSPEQLAPPRRRTTTHTDSPLASPSIFEWSFETEDDPARRSPSDPVLAGAGDDSASDNDDDDVVVELGVS
ncbi:uncharacterized protein AMSG_11109 [Thecamonas trahens ATCC 50062]|uniref:NadR/Ttd14 AAA domain-containing protein n=1 Tax=Thecamonas trahens ATCC 50062 TaxID=461836 RepID=A0A0L0DT53_THETB|nr:hypothetical protein AMSG_11109 [Thecamonas trahens ATCC 50062]KNC55445.1 hypothetical protein AMSG_11109 [Thecamonas trahens ATCC 50062]|eukprot:XP_013752982.1 hypothetical protein AMSG_11109 [Thecamonas trahens ATCC 50062]